MSSTGPPPAAAARPAAGLAVNASWLLAADVVGKLSSFLFVVIVTRNLGVERYGWFNFALAFLPLFLTPAGWGIDVSLLRDVARAPAGAAQDFAISATVRLAFAGGALALGLLGAALLTPSRAAYEVALLVGAALFLDEVASFLGVIFKASERMALPALAGAGNRILSAALAGIVLVLGGGALATSAAYAVGSLAGVLALVLATRRHFGRLPLGLDRDRARVLVRKGAPLALAAVLNTAMFRVDTILLQAISGAAAVGIYGIAYRFLDSFLFVAWGLSGAVLPRVARTGAGEGLGSVLGVAATVALAVHLPLAVGAPAAAAWAVETAFSGRAAAAAGAVPWLTAAGVCYALAYLGRTTLIGLGQRRSVVIVAALALTTNVVANLVVIPIHGPTGAGAVTFLTELVEMVVLVALVRRAVPSARLGRLAAVVAVAALVMGLVLAISGARGPAAVVVGGAAYVTVLGMLVATVARPALVEARAVLRRPAPAATGALPS